MKWAMLFLLLISASQSFAQQKEPHRFWDRENIVLFSGVAAARIADLDLTWRFRSPACSYYPTEIVCVRRNEGLLSNSFVDNKPLFTTYSLGAVGLQILASYELHRAGHYRLERVSAIVHIGIIGGGDIYSYQMQPHAPNASLPRVP